MQLTHTYKSKANINSLYTLTKQTLFNFIDEHAEVFEALTRNGYPFGGNWLPVSRYAAEPKPADAIRKQLTGVQQQVDGLTQTVAQLSDRIGSVQSAPGINEIGINRFRALRARS